MNLSANICKALPKSLILKSATFFLRRYRLLLVLSACFLTNQALGAALPPTNFIPLTLKECLSKLTTDNPLLLAALEDIRKEQLGEKIVNGKSSPIILFNVLTGPVPAAHGDALNTTTPVNDYKHIVRGLGPFFKGELLFIQPLWSFGKLGAGLEAAESLTKIKKEELTTLKWTLISQIKALYYGWLFANDMQDFLKEIQEKIELAKDYVTKGLQTANSQVSPLDQLKIKAYELELQNQRVEVTKRLAIIKDALLRLLQLPPEQPFRPADQNLKMLEKLLFISNSSQSLLLDELNNQTVAAYFETLLTESLENSPEFKSLKAGLVALQAKYEVYKGRYYPDIFLGAGIRYGVAPNRNWQKSPFANDGFNYFDLGALLGLRYQWETGVLKHELEQIKAERRSLEIKKDALVAKIKHNLHEALNNLQASKEKISTNQLAIKVTRSLSASLSNGLELGNASTKELLDAFASYIKARFNLLESIYEHNVAVAKLSEVLLSELQPELH